MASRIKKSDMVVVIAGRDKGKTGKVLRMVPKSDRVVVEGINRVHKHVKPSQRHPKGGRIRKEAPIHISNVALLDPTTNKASRVKFEIREGVKHRVTKRSKTDLGRVSSKA